MAAAFLAIVLLVPASPISLTREDAPKTSLAADPATTATARLPRRHPPDTGYRRRFGWHHPVRERYPHAQRHHSNRS